MAHTHIYGGTGIHTPIETASTKTAMMQKKCEVAIAVATTHFYGPTDRPTDRAT